MIKVWTLVHKGAAQSVKQITEQQQHDQALAKGEAGYARAAGKVLLGTQNRTLVLRHGYSRRMHHDSHRPNDTTTATSMKHSNESVRGDLEWQSLIWKAGQHDQVHSRADDTTFVEEPQPAYTKSTMCTIQHPRYTDRFCFPTPLPVMPNSPRRR